MPAGDSTEPISEPETSEEDSQTSSLSQGESMPKLDKDFALKLIPEFDGNRDNFHKFISCCDIVATDVNASDTTLLLNIIKSKLSGAAYAIIKYKTVDKWEDLKKILQDQFLEKRTLAQIQNDLVNCKQWSHEDVRSFGNRIERLLMDLNDACVASEGQAAADVIQRLNDKTALKAFVDGLQSPLRIIIKASRFTKLNEAIESAVEEERSTTGRNPSRFHPKCTFCHKTGHTASNCFLKISNKHQGANLPKIPKPEIKREPAERIFVITCSYCKNKGHHIKDCRKRLYNQNRANQARTSERQGNDRRPGPIGGLTRAASLQ